ncbi:MAG: hypothetical protein AB4063_11250 [Crocosphaera sp.]
MKIDSYPNVLVNIVHKIIQEQDDHFIEKMRQEDEETLEEIYEHTLIDEYRTPYMYELTDKEYTHFSDKLIEDISELTTLLVK